MHWATGGALIGCVATVLQAQQAKGKAKGDLMFMHKSLGLLSGMLVAPRLALRLSSKFPGHVPGPAWEQFAASASHYALYGWMLVMPVTGIAMGYYGGKGLPFFTTTIPGAPTPDGAIAKQAFSIHKQAGVYGKYLIPMHVAGAAKHVVMGKNIFSRINPFGAAPAAAKVAAA